MQEQVNLSVIMPVYNEAKTVEEILTRLSKVKEVSEIIVVDDGSTDDSVKLIKKFALKNKNIKFFAKQNGGKGSAVRFGLSKVAGNYVMIQDADLEYDPADIPAMLAPVLTDKAKVIFGSRFLGPHSNLLFWHRAGNFFLNLVINLLYDTTLSDMETCYKLLPTDLMKELDLKANGFDLEPEITCKVLQKKIRIFEVPISYVGRDFTEGKKITWEDGFAALAMIFKIKFADIF